MKSLFNRDSSFRFRFIIVIMIAISMIVSDSYFSMFSQIRTYMDDIVGFFYSISNSPRQFAEIVLNILSSRDQLEFENRALRQELFLKKSDLLILNQYKQENARLRELLGSPLRQDEQKMLVGVISSISNPYSDQIVIDKGSTNGVYEGQPLISEKGVIGQVISVSKSTSRVLLICDVSHALPVQVLRNNNRMIAIGHGCTATLQLENISSNTDLRIGDILVTSGLGGHFPEGYPVAIISSIKRDTQRAQITVRARPTASLRCLRYLLLFRSSKHDKANYIISPEEVNHVACERLTKTNHDLFSIRKN